MKELKKNVTLFSFKKVKIFPGNLGGLLAGFYSGKVAVWFHGQSTRC